MVEELFSLLGLLAKHTFKKLLTSTYMLDGTLGLQIQRSTYNMNELL